MQIPILSGIYTDTDPQFRIEYPVNLVPVAVPQGISNSYLRPADGIRQITTGQGVDRGSINWNDKCYRVSGTKLIRLNADSTIDVIGDVGGNDQVTFDYSFDRLAIASNDNLFYYDGTTLTQVTDPDLGTVVDMVWVDGYFMTTDGEFLIVTELNDPTAVNPLKYGGSEADPDPVLALQKIRNEVYAINRHTIELFDNVGGDNFPFVRIEGAQIQKGAVGTHACCEYLDTMAFVGSARNESPSVYVISGSQAQRIATNEIDNILLDYTMSQIKQILVESKNGKGHEFLYIHLPDQTLVYDATSSNVLGTPIWFVLKTNGQYKARNLTWCYNKWICGDPSSSKLGYLDSSISTHYGNKTQWQFSTPIVFNNGQGAIFHELELVAISGQQTLNDAEISTQHTNDGQTYTQLESIKAKRNRLCWRRQGRMGKWRVQRFVGDSDAQIAVATLDARLEPLAY